MLSIFNILFRIESNQISRIEWFDDNGDLPSKYRVMSIPTFMVFSGGKPIDQVVGAIGEDGLRHFIQKHINAT